MIKLKNGLILSIIFCLVCFAVSCFLSYQTRDTVLDSDASSEMVLSKHLSETNQILSKEWYYSTELRVVNTQLIYSLIFKLTDNWGMVRFISSVIFRVMILASYFYFMSQTEINLKYVFYSAGLMMLPFSTAYGRIILLHSYYVPHTIFGFLTLGMFLQIFRCKSRSSRAILFALLMVFAFVGCLGGMRYLMILYVPLVLLCTVKFLKKEELSTIALPVSKNQTEVVRDILLSSEAKALGISICGLMCALGGYVYNSKILSKVYSFQDYSGTVLEVLSSENLTKVFEYFCQATGYNNGAKLLSVTGILSVLILGVFLFVIYRSFVLTKDEGLEKHKQIIPLFFLSSLIINFFVMIFTGIVFALYFLPCLVFIFPLIALFMDIKLETNLLLHKIATLILVCVMICSSIITTQYLLRRPEESPVVYSGILYSQVNQVERLSPVVKFLSANGYSIGMGTFWNANVITEMTNGQMEMVPIEIKENEYIKLYEWLTFKKYQNISYCSDKKVFVILDSAEIDRFYPVISKHYIINRVYQDNDFSVYAFE